MSAGALPREGAEGPLALGQRLSAGVLDGGLSRATAARILGWANVASGRARFKVFSLYREEEASHSSVLMCGEGVALILDTLDCPAQSQSLAVHRLPSRDDKLVV